MQGNHIGSIPSETTSYGVQVEAGASDRYVLAMNTLTGNVRGALADGGRGVHKTVSGNV